MNKGLIATTTFVLGTTAIGVGFVGDTNACGEIQGWSAPVTIFLTLTTAAVLGYFAGGGNRANQLRAELVAIREAFEADPPADLGSTYQLAAHYYGLVNKAKPVLSTAIDKLGGGK